jgi:predicted nuclease with TOPRIM domain
MTELPEAFCKLQEANDNLQDQVDELTVKLARSEEDYIKLQVAYQALKLTFDILNERTE